MTLDNIVLFPKWQERLESASLEALKKKRYDEALEKLEQLIEYRVDHQEIMVAKMICLMELGKHNAAETFAETLLNKNDDGYFHYMHIYLTILFQTNQYQRLMETVENELKDKAVPAVMKEQFHQLYAISQNMQRDLADKRSREDYLEFERAIDEQDDHRQWVVITRLQSAGVNPRESMYRILENEMVSPVVKTALLLWVKEQTIEKKLRIYKFGKVIELYTSNLPSLDEDIAKREVLFRLRHLENDNPTLYQMIETVFRQYLYVRYPFSINKEDSYFIAKALHIIAKSNLQALDEMPQDDKVKRYIEEIQVFQAMYLAVTDG